MDFEKYLRYGRIPFLRNPEIGESGKRPIRTVLVNPPKLPKRRGGLPRGILAIVFYLIRP